MGLKGGERENGLRERDRLEGGWVRKEERDELEGSRARVRRVQTVCPYKCVFDDVTVSFHWRSSLSVSTGFPSPDLAAAEDCGNLSPALW